MELSQFKNLIKEIEAYEYMIKYSDDFIALVEVKKHDYPIYITTGSASLNLLSFKDETISFLEDIKNTARLKIAEIKVELRKQGVKIL